MNTITKIFLNNSSVITKYFVVGDSAKPLSKVYNETNYLAIKFTLNDLKCDFDNSENLSNDEIQGVFYNKSINEVNDYFNNINFFRSNESQINILNTTLTADINFSSNRKNVSVNFSKLDNKKNVSIYFLLNKTSWGNLSYTNISDLENYFENKFSSTSYNSTFFVVDKDPIIGYHFDDLPSENISFEFEGIIDGVLIEAGAVVYSGSRDFIFNYRDTSEDGCEQEVFKNGGSGVKSICINFLSDGINGNIKNNIKNNSGDNIKNNSGDNNLTINGIDIKINLSPNYKAEFIKNSYNLQNGNYSCLGIIETDILKSCDEGTNIDDRIWVKIYKNTPQLPENNVDLEIISLSTSATIKFINSSPIIGLNNILYCVNSSDATTCNDYTKSVNIDTKKVITCDSGDEFGCIKKIFWKIKFIDGNYSEVKNKPIELLNLGSACYNDCRSSPSPNLLLASCNRINSCQFFINNSDNGNVAANLCNYKAPNTRVAFNSTNDLICPNKLTSSIFTTTTKQQYFNKKHIPISSATQHGG